MLKFLITPMLLIGGLILVHGQSLNTHLSGEILGEKVIQKFFQSPYEGVKIWREPTADYLLAFGIADVNPKSGLSNLNRIAKTKARREVLEFLKGSNISSEVIIVNEEVVTDRGVRYYESYLQRISESSAGFVEGMEVLTTWHTPDKLGYIVCIYKKIEDED